ncbi:MAG TPA: pyridoxamine 5'-phosphate oxidase family protein, partial [Acidimicrobiia bacterium]|nr:pyridoxamine 5'-phosphate oxidase family protein [Acidimicrobiia bacterium]
HSSANYRSVVVHGQGRLLNGDEKTRALDSVIDSVIPGRLADLRPYAESEISQTSVVELGLDEVSAKMRTGGPDDDPGDTEFDVWAGVVPFRLQPGEPIPAEDLKPGIAVPDYLRPYRR